ncbi:hypothetical protein ACEQPO_12140 [Bacillus sp. SL00103]
MISGSKRKRDAAANIGIIGGGAIGLLCASYLTRIMTSQSLQEETNRQKRFEHSVLSEQ